MINKFLFEFVCLDIHYIYILCVHWLNGIGINKQYKQSSESIQNMNLFNGTEPKCVNIERVLSIDVTT